MAASSLTLKYSINNYKKKKVTHNMTYQVNKHQLIERLI